MEAIGSLADGFHVALLPENLLAAFIGVLLGTLVGLLPGLGPTATIALLLSLSVGLDPITAIILLAGIYYGAMYGGSTTAILLNLPGEAASVVTAMDGYQMARQGRAGPALAIAGISSFIAGTVGLFGLALLAPPLAKLALTFGPAEYFGVLMVGFTVIVSLAGPSLTKGLAAAGVGLLLGMVGLDPQTGNARFTFGTTQLLGGIDSIAVIVGLYGLAEVIANAESSMKSAYVQSIGRLYPTLRDLRDSAGAIGRGTVLGFLLGILPGGNPAVASFLSYDLEKRVSRSPERFGHGAIQGVAGPEGANNAATSAGFIPLFTLGLPTSPVLAVLLGALLVHGLQPGPLLFSGDSPFVWAVIASMYIGNVMLIVLNLPLVGLWVRILQVPPSILAAIVIAIAFVGTFGVRNNMFDVAIAVAFGLLGYAMRKLAYPAAPLLLGLILAERTEQSLRQAVGLSESGLGVFLERPVALALVVLAIGLLGVSLLAHRKRLELVEGVGDAD